MKDLVCPPVSDEMLTEFMKLDKVLENTFGLNMSHDYDRIHDLVHNFLQHHRCSDEYKYGDVEEFKESFISRIKVCIILFIALKCALEVHQFMYPHKPESKLEPGGANDAKTQDGGEEKMISSLTKIITVSDSILFIICGIFISYKFDTTRSYLHWIARKAGRPELVSGWNPAISVTLVDSFIISLCGGFLAYRQSRELYSQLPKSCQF